MPKTLKIYSTLILLLIIVSCSNAPKTHFYLIDYPVQAAKENTDPVHPVVLGVSKFSVEPLYSDTRLVYRENPYEGNYYFYHRWITNPGKMVTDKTIEQLAASNLVKQVVSFPQQTQCDFVLNGNIKALEEWDENNQWYAKVKIDFELVEKTSRKLIWKKTIEKQNPVMKKSPFEVVFGINQCVKLCVEDVQQALSKILAELE
ncbi:membrane integrity-associated transporter subunit PqiC [candidate division KSB1 bacterium]|nr:membrane integrity-associated transporter subunit PqiC [candidate division KSB1 bacterium]